MILAHMFQQGRWVAVVAQNEWMLNFLKENSRGISKNILAFKARETQLKLT